MIRRLTLRRLVVLALLALVAIPALECATPTALTVTVHDSEVPCAKGSTVELVGGQHLAELPQKAPSSVSTRCDADGRRGSVVIVPAGAKDETVAFAVMQRADGQPADGCLQPAQASGCIVAKRQLRFEKHNESEMRVDLRLSCLGVLCSIEQTCVRGACVDAHTTCGASCDERALIPGADSGVDSGFPGVLSACACGVSSCTNGDAGAVDLDWTQWPMPNSSVDVSAGAPNPQSYSDNGDGTVTDQVTGLTWQQAAAPGTYSQPQAPCYCSGLALAGRADWRLPTYVELISIVDYGRQRPAIDPTGFPASPTGNFWSSTSWAGSPFRAWDVDFNSGYATNDDASKMDNVRCVRAAVPPVAGNADSSAPPGRYTITAGTVYDAVTKLTWQQLPVLNYTQSGALGYCASLSLSGTGWRLPTVKELVTLIDVTRSEPAIDSTAFPGIQTRNNYWSSTPVAGTPSNAWYVSFHEGGSLYSLMQNERRAGGPSDSGSGAIGRKAWSSGLRRAPSGRSGSLG